MKLKDLITISSCEKFAIFGKGYRLTFDYATDDYDTLNSKLLDLTVVDCFADGDVLIIEVA